MTSDWDRSWIQFEDGLGRTYDCDMNPIYDETWDRPWWRKLLGLPAKRQTLVRRWWE